MKRKTIFGCSIEDMYTVSLMGWQYCQDELASFSEAYPFYTLDYVSNAIADIEKAQDMLDEEQRNAITKQDREDLTVSADECLNNWQTLKIYIINGYPAATAEIKLQAAGSAYYAKAAKFKWSFLRSLLRVSNTFLADNKNDLIARMIMPETFVTKYTSDSDTCAKQNNDFFEAEVAKKRSTAEKQENDNKIFTAAMSMMADGKRLFVAEKAIRSQFVFSQLLAKVRGEGVASLSGYVYNANKQPVEGAAVTSKDLKYTATTDSKGRYKINRINADSSYTFSVTCPGYTPVEQVITFKPGIASRASFDLQNVMKKVA